MFFFFFFLPTACENIIVALHEDIYDQTSDKEQEKASSPKGKSAVCQFTLSSEQLLVKQGADVISSIQEQVTWRESECV